MHYFCVYFFNFQHKMAMHTPLGSSDLILSMGILETSSIGGGSSDVQHHSGSSLKTDASEYNHIFHCCTSTGGSPLSVALLAISDSSSSSDHKVPSFFCV